MHPPHCSNLGGYEQECVFFTSLSRITLMVSVLPYLLPIARFVRLIKGADFLVNGATSIARRFHVSDLVTGLTIVAVGASLPELATSAMAAYKKTPRLLSGMWSVPTSLISFVLAASSIIKSLHDFI